MTLSKHLMELGRSGEEFELNLRVRGRVIVGPHGQAISGGGHGACVKIMLEPRNFTDIHDTRAVFFDLDEIVEIQK